MSAIPFCQLMPYGAPDLRRAARPHMIGALLLSSALVTAAFVVAWTFRSLFPSGPTTEILRLPQPHRPEQIDIIVQPPPLVPEAAPARPATAQAVEAIPVPVPDAAVPEDRTVKSQSEYVQDAGSTATTPTGLSIPDGTGDEPANLPGNVALVDRLPEPIVRVSPKYPDLAVQAGVEGTVVVHVLVGKDGRVRDVQLHPEKHQPMLDEAALQAARRWTFEPALSSGHPVPVWVVVPFRFALR